MVLIESIDPPLVSWEYPSWRWFLVKPWEELACFDTDQSLQKSNRREKNLGSLVTPWQINITMESPSLSSVNQPSLNVPFSSSQPFLVYKLAEAIGDDFPIFSNRPLSPSQATSGAVGWGGRRWYPHGEARDARGLRGAKELGDVVGDQEIGGVREPKSRWLTCKNDQTSGVLQSKMLVSVSKMVV